MIVPWPVEVPERWDEDTGPYFVQVAALRSDEAAKREWQRLRVVHPELLSEVDVGVIRADLGESQGIYFRLRAGPLELEGAERNERYQAQAETMPQFAEYTESAGGRIIPVIALERV